MIWVSQASLPICQNPKLGDQPSLQQMPSSVAISLVPRLHLAHLLLSKAKPHHIL